MKKCGAATIKEIYRRGESAAIRIHVPKDSPDVSLSIHSSKNGHDRNTCGSRTLVTHIGGDWKGKDTLFVYDPNQSLPLIPPEEQIEMMDETLIIPMHTLGGMVNGLGGAGDCSKASIGTLLNEMVNVYLHRKKPAIEQATGDGAMLADTAEDSSDNKGEGIIDHARIQMNGDLFIVRTECSQAGKMHENWCRGTASTPRPKANAFPLEYFVKAATTGEPYVCMLNPDGTHKPHLWDEENETNADVPSKLTEDVCMVEYVEMDEARRKCMDLGCTVISQNPSGLGAPLVVMDDDYITKEGFQIEYPREACSNCVKSERRQPPWMTESCCECNGGVRYGWQSVPLKRFSQKKAHVIPPENLAPELFPMGFGAADDESGAPKATSMFAVAGAVAILAIVIVVAAKIMMRKGAKAA